MFGIKKLKHENEQLKLINEKLQDRITALLLNDAELRQFSISYTLTESDLITHKRQSARKKVALDRMARSLGYRILNTFKSTEVVKDGVVVGYKIDVLVGTKRHDKAGD